MGLYPKWNLLESDDLREVLDRDGGSVQSKLDALGVIGLFLPADEAGKAATRDDPRSGGVLGSA